MSKLVICKSCGKEIVKGTKCPNCGHDQRNFFMKHKIITVILVIFIIGCFSSAMRGNKETITPSIVADSATNGNKGTTVAKLKTWQKVTEFKGNSIKNTQKFTVGNDWKIVWSTTPTSIGNMNFVIAVNDENGSPVSIAANIIGKGSDESYMTTAGTFSLGINTAQNYDIIIEEKK